MELDQLCAKYLEILEKTKIRHTARTYSKFLTVGPLYKFESLQVLTNYFINMNCTIDM